MKPLLPVAFLAVAAASGAELAADLAAGIPATVVLDLNVDDGDLANPGGYFPAEDPVAHVVRRISIENTGDHPIKNPDVRLNGLPLLPVSDPVAMLGATGAKDFTEVFEKWAARRVHGTNDLDAGRNPRAVLAGFGATFCGDDSRALGELAVRLGGEMRFARLAGHSVGEFRVGGDWMLLDGDQNAFYLDWDNRTICSEADILADPLLALRTKVFGRQAEWKEDAAWQNSSRFDLVGAGRVVKRFKAKPGPAISWKLMSGEKIVIDLVRIPDRVCGANEALQANPVLRRVAREVEVTIDPEQRVGEAAVMPWPILRAGDRWIAKPGDEPVVESPPGGRRIFCQAAASQFGSLNSGANVLVLANDEGALRVTFDVADSKRRVTPPPKVAGGSGSVPEFRIEAAGADRMWWQISDNESFERVPPNLDRVEAYSSRGIVLCPLDQTFLSPGRDYRFRGKVRRDGVWSDWSEAVKFRARKSDQPEIERFEVDSEDAATVHWKAGDGDMLVFGSNRIDFLPEIFGDAEAVRIENGVMPESRPNRNLLTVAPASAGQAVVPLRACYRLIVRKDGALSVPSALVRLPRGTNIPRAMALRNRHEKEGGLVGRDIATEAAVDE